MYIACFSWLLSYKASNLNMMIIKPEHFAPQTDAEFMEHGHYRICIDGIELLSNELGRVNSDKFNALYINESEKITTGRQIFILNDSVNLDLEQCLLYVEDVCKIFYNKMLLIEGVSQDEEMFFNIPLNKIDELDLLIEEFLT